MTYKIFIFVLKNHEKVQSNLKAKGAGISFGNYQKSKHTSKKVIHALILLNCDERKYSDKVKNEDVVKVLQIGHRTIDRVKKKFVEEGFEAALTSRPTTRVYDKKADGDVEAHLVALSCSEPPTGFSRWSLRLLADKMVEFGICGGYIS